MPSKKVDQSVSHSVYVHIMCSNRRSTDLTTLKSNQLSAQPHPLLVLVSSIRCIPCVFNNHSTNLTLTSITSHVHHNSKL